MTHTCTHSHNIFIYASEICEMLEISKPSAYKIIKQLNDELNADGFLVIDGRTNRKYFLTKIYGEYPQTDGGLT